MLDLGLGLEEVPNARRQATADLGLLLLLLLVFLLFLLRGRVQYGSQREHKILTFSSFAASASAAGASAAGSAAGAASAAGASAAAATSLIGPISHVLEA